jgi:hypothetical protein
MATGAVRHIAEATGRSPAGPLQCLGAGGRAVGELAVHDLVLAIVESAR